QQALETAVRTVIKDPSAAAGIAAPEFGLPATVIERSIEFSNLVVERATTARTDLTTLFDVLAKEDPRIIGGKQPDDGFFAL
ncbi:MAG: ABC transporter substrate-binding protein, partial [Afipia sp.]|nr:ABC transporter substrate-binding protein [Afipia sp.]